MYRSFIACASLCLLAGCSTGEVKLGVDVASVQQQLQAAAGDQVTTGRGEELALTRVRLLLGHAKVGYGGCMEDEGADVGPFVVDLTEDEILNGAHREFSLGELATGTYRGAEIEIQPLEADQDASGDEFADFKSSGASVLVEGLYQGAEFSFAGHFLAEQGTDGEVTVDEKEPVSLSLTVDASTWLRDAEGLVQDPTDATFHESQAVAICKTLDTQPQLEAADAPRHRRGGPGGGGARAHCVEIVP